MDDFESPPRNRNRKLKIGGTLWAAYNAAVYAIDFERRSHRDRVDDLCLAEGAALKERALRLSDEHIETH
jgi:hypothetical protein